MKYTYFLCLATAGSSLLAQETSSRGQIIEMSPVTVQSSPLIPELEDITQAWSVYEGDTLEESKSQTLGETLSNKPGISQTFYGPNASRPVIRGLDGLRIRVLRNGLDTFDVSAASVDHAVAVDPLLIDRIEVLRGSSALLYGANAIGGVVNAIDRNVPRTLISDQYEGTARFGYSSVNDGWNLGAVSFAGKDGFVFQANGTYRNTDNYSVPNFRLPEGDLTDVVMNSQSETWSAGFGGSYIFENGHAGMAYSRFETNYGVPNEEAPTIDLKRNRVESRAAFAPEGLEWLSNIELQLAYGDYEHSEIESSGEIAATFLREGIETRLAFIHETDRWHGAFGFQGNFDDLSVSGEENFFAGESSRNPAITNEDSQRLAFFVIEEYDINDQLSVNGGLRLETFLRQLTGADDRDDYTISASTGVIYRPSPGWSVGGNLNYTQRPPETAELYSDGPHLAVGAFEVGNPSLSKEKALGIEGLIRRTAGNVTGQVSIFYTSFADYIFLTDTGNEIEFGHEHEGEEEHEEEEEEEIFLAERIYRDVTARFYGIEAEVQWLAYEDDRLSLTVNSYADMIRARNATNDTFLPRTPPWHLGVGATLNYENFRFTMEVNQTGKQNKTAPDEESTSGYTLVELSGSYHIYSDAVDLELYIRGTNLANERAFVHTSFLRDTAPLPGAGVETGITLQF